MRSDFLELRELLEDLRDGVFEDLAGVGRDEETEFVEEEVSGRFAVGGLFGGRLFGGGGGGA